MKFYLGTHETSWLTKLDVPLFVSRRRFLVRRADFLRRKIPAAIAPWALDSGGFTELSMFGEWRTGTQQYIEDVRRLEEEAGNLDWVAPQDWMCEPFITAKTGLTVRDHQERTVSNFITLRDELGQLVIPVLQGWERDDYHRCWEMYEAAGIRLDLEPVVGIGSVCRRQNTSEAGMIVRSLGPLRLHYFGAKITGLEKFGDALESADSMSWSYEARRTFPLRGCTHKACNNCPRYALRWRDRCLQLLAQQRLEIVA